MKRSAFVVATVLLAAFAGDAAAEKKIYKCRNEKGEIYYANSFDRAKCGGGGAQLNEQGLAVRQIERQKTPEEIAAEKLAAEKAEEEKRRLEAEQHAEQVLMLSYASEDDLERAHDKSVEAIDTAIATTQMQLANQQKSLAELLASAAESERAGLEVSADVAKNIKLVRTQIESQNQFIARKEQEKIAEQAEYEARLKRYREVRAKHLEQIEGH